MVTRRSLVGLFVLATLLVIVGGSVFADPGITVGGESPVARFTFSPLNPLPGQDVWFDASSSYDSDGWIEAYTWDFNGDLVIDETGIKVYWVFPNPGVYRITLIVIDNDGKAAAEARSLVVVSPSLPLFLPQACFTSRATGHQTIWFDGSCSKGEITLYEWSFGDGRQRVTDQPFVPNVYRSPGNYPVILKVTDSWGRQSWFRDMVTVPVAQTRAIIRANIDLSNLSPELQVLLIASAVVAVLFVLVLVVKPG